jgi:predicted RNase H-like HicB family nuclease
MSAERYLTFGSIDSIFRSNTGRCLKWQHEPLPRFSIKEEDLYVAECPEVGTVSQGYTVEEALANLKEATELYLEEFPLPEISRPLMTTFEATVYA